MASHSEIAHRWAQDDRSARTLSSFNMIHRWESDGANIIFSHGYHFPIAAFMDAPDGGRVVLGNFHESRSNSTSKHQMHTWRAIPGRYRVFDVPNVHPAYKSGGPDHFHRDNLSAMIERAAEENAKSKRARVYKASHADRAQYWLREASRYAEAFGVEWKAPDIEALTEEVQKRAAEQAAQYAKERAEREAREVERMTLLRVHQAGDMTDWLNEIPNSRVPSSYSRTDDGSAFIRRSPDGADLQTSQGASVPWEHAVKAFRFVKLIRERGEGWKRNGHTVRVGHYTLDSVQPDGSFIAGCHFIKWQEIERLAHKHGVYDLTPSADAETITEGH